MAIYQKIKRNENVKLQNATLILVDDAITPHTFWNYIFINKKEYNSQKIEEELFTHELTHATQKHTFDVLLIEVLKIVFWFNPIFYFLKKSIQLNHEFLADTKVVSNHKNIPEYQYLLLNKTAWNNEYYLASNLNYLLTKKRLVMMTKQSSQTKILLKKLAVIPLLVGFIFLFAERVEAQEEIIEVVEETPEVQKNKVSNDNYQLIEVVEEPLNATDNIHNLDNELLREFTFRNIVSKIGKDKNGNAFYRNYYDLSKEEKSKLIPNKILTKEKLKKFQNFKTLKAQNKLPEIKRKDIIESYTVFASKIVNSKSFREGDYLSLNEIYKELSSKQRKKVKSPNSIYPKSISSKLESNRKKRLESGHVYTRIQKSKNSNPEKATPKELAEYNALAKKYNKQPKETRVVKLKDLKRLEYLYAKLSKKQRKNAQPFPECPLPPKPPVKVKEIKPIKIEVKKKPTVKEIKLKDKKQGFIPPPPPLKKGASKKEIERYKKAYANWSKKAGKYIPPPPRNHLNQIIKMAKKGAKFYYEGKPINSDKAIKLLKENKKLNVHSKSTNYSNYEVWISKNPIVKEIKVKDKKPKEIALNDKFKIILERNKNKVKLKCLSGCAWKELEFSTDRIKYINKYGITNSPKKSNDNFLFSLNLNNQKVNLKGIQGTNWKNLSFSSFKNEGILINRLGMSRINLLSNNTKYFLNNKPITKQELNKKVNPNQIKAISVKKEKGGYYSIYATSK